MTLGFYFDQTRCFGCHTCQVACKDVHGLDVGYLFREVSTYQVGSYPDARIFHYSASCNHCAAPQCVAVCPTGAMHISDEGTVQHTDDQCIGCKSCVQACPYHVPVYFDEDGIVRKCDACIELRQKGEQPACVASCPGRALEFGDLDELAQKHAGDVDLVNKVSVLPDPSTTPSLLIKPKDIALQDNPTRLLM